MVDLTHLEIKSYLNYSNFITVDKNLSLLSSRVYIERIIQEHIYENQNRKKISAVENTLSFFMSKQIKANFACGRKW